MLRPCSQCSVSADEPGVCRQCGLEKIPAGGGEAGAGSERYPWLVEIHSPTQPRCLGTLIGSRFVVTAGHCLVHWVDWNRNKFIKLLPAGEVKVVVLTCNLNLKVVAAF